MSFFERRIRGPLVGLLRQGLSPEGLARSRGLAPGDSGPGGPLCLGHGAGVACAAELLPPSLIPG